VNAPLPAAGADAINDYFCPCPRGLEDALVSEVRAAGATDAAALAGGVMCRGTLDAAYRINLHSRLASRVMLLLARGSYRNEDDLYRLAVSILGRNGSTTAAPCASTSPQSVRR
jgi:putative N6-adenine-specific DNA methylase